MGAIKRGRSIFFQICLHDLKHCIHSSGGRALACQFHAPKFDPALCTIFAFLDLLMEKLCKRQKHVRIAQSVGCPSISRVVTGSSPLEILS